MCAAAGVCPGALAGDSPPLALASTAANGTRVLVVIARLRGLLELHSELVDEVERELDQDARPAAAPQPR